VTQSPPPATSSSQAAGDPLSQALALHNAGRLDEALVIYQELLLTEPNNQYAAYNIGLINQTRGNNEVAIDFYDRALASDGSFSSAGYNRALSLRDVGRIDDSLAQFEVLMFQDGDNASMLYNYGNLLIAQGQVEQGVELVNRAIELNPALRGD
jgi:tetratricopeptide (TPR) repeat protein